MNLRRFVIALLVLAALGCAVPGLRAQDGLQGALSQDVVVQPLGSSYVGVFERRLAAADFDGDRHPDGALLLPFSSRADDVRMSYRLEVHLSNSSNTELSFEATDRALSVVALDINHDGMTDLVVEQALTHRRLHVWLGDGRGGFRKARLEEFPENDDRGGNEASTPGSEQEPAVVTLPSEQRFGAELLISSHVSGRPPSAYDYCSPAAVSSRSLLFALPASLRGPPFPPSV